MGDRTESISDQVSVRCQTRRFEARSHPLFILDNPPHALHGVSARECTDFARFSDSGDVQGGQPDGLPEQVGDAVCGELELRADGWGGRGADVGALADGADGGYVL